MNLATFLDTYRDALAHAVIQAYPPLYDAQARQASAFDLRRLLRRPLGAQADAIRATALALQQSGSASIVGEMGLVSPGPHSASVIASTDCEFVAVDEKRFQFLVQQTPYFAIQVMRLMAESLRATNKLLAKGLG